MESEELYHQSTQPLERLFTNPICQKTFVALPRIYGLKTHQYKRKRKPIIQYSLKQCLACDSKTHNCQKPKFRNSSLTRIETRSNKLKKESLINIRSLSHTKSSKNSHPALLKLEEMSPLKDQQSNHKISSTRGLILPSISRSSEDILSWQRNFNQLHSRQIKIIKNNISPIHQTLDEDRSVTPQPSLNLRVNSSNYLSEPVHNKKKQLNQIGIKIPFFNKLELSRETQKQDTYFRQFINKQSKEGVRDSQSYRSATSTTSYNIPSKGEMESFILNYKPFNPEFNLKQLTKSEKFQIISYKNGVYLGQCVDRQRHGKGVFICEKYIFQGEYRNGFKHFGSQCNSDGVYTGQMQNGLREGSGIFKWNNGEVYKGSWRQGMKHGKGIWTSKNGDSYDGQWSNNRQQGQGVHRHPNSVYEGSFRNFLKHGKGKELFSNGDQYEGQYNEGKPNGFGTYIWKNGDRYQGNFLNGFRHGLGRLQQDGSCYKVIQAILQRMLRTVLVIFNIRIRQVSKEFSEMTSLFYQILMIDVLVQELITELLIIKFAAKKKDQIDFYVTSIPLYQ